MIDRQKRLRWVVLALLFGAVPVSFQALAAREAIDASSAEDSATVEAGAGQADLDEALRLKIKSKDLRDLNNVIGRLETAIDKGLDEADGDFAERMLSDALLERATSLMKVITGRPRQDKGMQQIRQLVISDLRDVIAYGDPPAQTYLLLGKLSNDPREARRAINNYLKSKDLPDGERAEGLVIRARMVRDQKKSLSYMEQAIELAPDNIGYRLAKAIFQRRGKKLDDALVTVADVIERAPENVNAVILQGEIYREQNSFEEALASFAKATQLAPQAPAPYQNRGEIYRKQQKYDEAVEQYNEVLKLQPGVLLTLLHRADAYLAGGKFELALTDIEVVLKEKDLVAAHRLRADVLSRMDRLSEAIEEMEKISTAMPNQPELKMQLALYHLVGNQYNKAIEDYSAVLELQNGNVMALQARGGAYLNVGKHAEAIVDFTRAIKLAPKDPTTLNNFAWVLATSPEEDLRDGKKAVELASLACELTENKMPHILSTLAAAHAEAGDFENAIKWAQQAVDLNDPKHTPQITKELENYRNGKPWREKQDLEATPKQPLEDSLQEPTSDASLQR